MSLALERPDLPSERPEQSRSPARLRAVGEPARSAEEPEPLPEEAELVMTVLAELSAVQAEPAERRGALLAVCRLAKQGSPHLWTEHFRWERRGRGDRWSVGTRVVGVSLQL